jgi:N,N'-diacetyllegionaminate synthase
MNKTIFIAEAGVNHNGKVLIAKKLVDVAKQAKADFVKFQIFKTDDLVAKKSPLAKYQKINIKKNISQYEMLKKLELSREQHSLLISYCKKKKINYLASVFDIESLNFLRKKSSYIKIPSGEITNYQLLKNIKKKKFSKIFLSTGASNIEEVKIAVNILGKKNLYLLHANSEYPTKDIKDINLNILKTFKKEFNIDKVGYSDHTIYREVPIIAVGLGAKVIEKHFTINKNLKGPDHKASLSPEELVQTIKDIKKSNLLLGSYKKKPSNSEKKNIKIIRKSLVAKKNINKKDLFNDQNITFKRPQSKNNSMLYLKILGKKSKKNFKKNEIIKL